MRHPLFSVASILALAVLCGLAAAPSAFAQNPYPLDREKSRSRAQELVVEGFSFPLQIVGMTRFQVQRYDGEPGAGFSVKYAAVPDNNVWADVYIYDDTRALTGSDGSKNAEAEVSAVIGEIDRAVKAGFYKRAETLERWQEAGFSAARLRLSLKDRIVESFVFVTLHRDRFVKIRLSATKSSSGRRIASSFARAYSRLLSL
ncbi:hypothetical protein AB4072_00420 [Microvirga sp. 2MCAF38]|uniref:hypothetical protein n=1 Tax=Microvirga sp. 2MCAF38 TaxID=3232989 RepID=UPI003F9D76E5